MGCGRTESLLSEVELREVFMKYHLHQRVKSNDLLLSVLVILLALSVVLFVSQLDVILENIVGGFQL